MRSSIIAVICVIAFAGLTVLADERPNIVIIYADDLGYGDLGCYGSPTIRTPYLDRMAAQGLRFTDFYSTAEVCSPSRAALMTGRYPIRSGMFGRRRVLFPDSKGGLPSNEVTIAEILQAKGYATAQVGKWHLGIHEGSRPFEQGFEFSYGLPYSNDEDARPGVSDEDANSPTPFADGWNVPLISNGKIIERPADQTKLTQRYTETAISFIRQKKDNPFFLYMAHNFPHIPLFASPKFKGKSRAGIYGDTVEELDWSVGQVLETLKQEGISERTLVFFSSDNGPWLIMGNQAGSAGLLREGKGSTWEGGMRVPGIAFWPGKIAPGVTSEPVNTMDLFVTAVSLGHGTLPANTTIDGRDVTSLLLHGTPPPTSPFFYYRGNQLMACRLGEWKAHFFTQAGYGQPSPEQHDPPLLFHLGLDPSEKRNVAAEHPDVIARIRDAVIRHQSNLVPGNPQFD